VDVASRQGINELFQALTVAGIRVASMRNKANRLEELFIRLVDQKSDGRAA
jgi:ABC-2 type transport system ATP-binding protein